MALGLLASFTAVGADHRDLAAKWLGEMSQDVRRLPGVISRRHGVMTNQLGRPPTPDSAVTLLDLYDVDPAALADALAAVRAREAADGSELMAVVSRREHRLYTPLPVPDVAGADGGPVGQIVNIVGWQARPGRERNLDDWYTQEHIPLLMRFPGWLRVRRFELIDGPGARFATIHDIRAAEFLGAPSPAKTEAKASPWRARVVAERAQFTTERFQMSKEC